MLIGEFIGENPIIGHYDIIHRFSERLQVRVSVKIPYLVGYGQKDRLDGL
jgi:hypothetical protein